MLKKSKKSLVLCYLLAQFICFYANALQDIENQAQKLALYIDNSVDKYLEQKHHDVLRLDKLPFLPILNEDFFPLYLDLSKSIKKASKKHDNFQSSRFEGFKKIIESFDKWHNLGQPNLKKYEQYCALLPTQHDCSDIKISKKINDSCCNLRWYLDSITGCSYEELLIFSHFLTSFWQPTTCPHFESNAGFPWYQFSLENFYVENEPQDWKLMRSYFTGADYNGQFSPAGLAQFASVLVFLPCPFVLGSEDFLDFFLHDFAPLGVILLKTVADDILYSPAHFYLHDIFHAANYLLTFYGYSIEKGLEDTKNILKGAAAEDLLSIGHHRRKIIKSMVGNIVKNKKFLNSDLANDKGNIICENANMPHGFYEHTKDMLHSMFDLMMFYLIHEVTFSTGFKYHFEQIKILTGQGGNLWLDTTLKNRLDNDNNLGGLFLPQVQKLSADNKLKLYYQTLGTCAYLGRKRNIDMNYQQWYEKILQLMQHSSQTFNLSKIDFSPNFFVFYHKKLSSNYNDLDKAKVHASFEKEFATHKTHVLILPSAENFKKPNCIFISYKE